MARLSKSKSATKKSATKHLNKSPRKSTKKYMKKSPTKSFRKSSSKKSTSNSKSTGPNRFSSKLHLKRGLLRKHGYSSKDPQRERHIALHEAMGEFGSLSVARKLQVVANLSGNEVLIADAKWAFAQHRNNPVYIY